MILWDGIPSISEEQKTKVDNAHDDRNEAGRMYMAQYYVDHPEEFDELLINMTKIRENRLVEMYKSARLSNDNLVGLEKSYLNWR